MKKIILLFTIISFIYACNSDSDTKTASNSDSLRVDTTNPNTESKIKAWEIDSTEGIDMEKFTGMPPHNQTKTIISDSNLTVYQEIIDSFDLKNIEWKSARYRDKDSMTYARLRGIKVGSDSARVGNYRTWIIKVKQKKETLLAAPLYFDIVTICPPPDNANCLSLSATHSTNSKK